jgi:hypothetical protein
VMPVIPRDEWDTREQYLEYLRHLAACIILAGPFASEKKCLKSAVALAMVLTIYRINHLPSPVVIRLKKIRQCSAKRGTDYKPVPQETLVSKFAVNAFRVDPSCLKDCLDLYGICVRVKD